MKTLSVRQPWAWAICEHNKNIENRTWASKYIGPLLIHAGKQYDEAGELWLREHWFSVPQDLPRGGIVGCVRMAGCVQESESPWFFGPNGFVFEDRHPLPFFECKGQLGFFDVKLPIGSAS